MHVWSISSRASITAGHTMHRKHEPIHISYTHQPRTDAEEQAGQESFISCCLTYALARANCWPKPGNGPAYQRKGSVPLPKLREVLVIHPPAVA